MPENRKVQFAPQKGNTETSDTSDVGDGDTGESDNEATNIFSLADSSDDDQQPAVSMSPFGTMWTTLDLWKTKATTSFLQGSEENVLPQGPTDETEIAAADPSSVLATPSHTFLRRSSLVQSVSPYLVDLRTVLGASSTIDQDLPFLISTFSLSQAVPSFSPGQWRTVAAVFLELLLRKNSNSSILKQKNFLDEQGIRCDEFQVFLDLFT